MAINSAAGSTSGGFQKAVRNPSYDSRGNIIGSATPGGQALGFSQGNYGIGRLIAAQLAALNQGDPSQGGSLTEEELRRTAMRQLGGQ